MSGQPMTQRQVMEQARPTDAVERNVKPVRDVRWILAVVDDNGQDRAAVLIVAGADQFEDFRSRMAAAKVKRVRADDWKRCNLDPATMTVYVRGGQLVELCAEYRENLPGGFRNRRGRFMPNPPQTVTPRWMDAAMARRPIVALLPDEHFDHVPADQWEGHVITEEEIVAAAAAAAGARNLWAALGVGDLGVEP